MFKVLCRLVCFLLIVNVFLYTTNFFCIAAFSFANIHIIMNNNLCKFYIKKYSIWEYMTRCAIIVRLAFACKYEENLAIFTSRNLHRTKYLFISKK